ncbi:MAG: hypothetical protein LW809_03415, partial [Vampirovibrionales bacterium]|nr:hypothetical protein [Vampirovibrionales bacterium]
RKEVISGFSFKSRLEKVVGGFAPQSPLPLDDGEGLGASIGAGGFVGRIVLEIIVLSSFYRCLNGK